MTVILTRDPVQSAVYIGETLLFQAQKVNLQADLLDVFFQKMFASSFYDVTRCYIRCRTGSAAMGSAVMFDQINQTGNQLFSVNFAGLNPNVGLIATPSFPAGTVPVYTNTPFFTVTSVPITACIADVYMWGHDVTFVSAN